MDALHFGTRNKRGDWALKAAVQTASSSAAPISLRKFMAFRPGYLWLWNALHRTTALAWWAFVVPPIETMARLSWRWTLWIYAVNAAGIFVFHGEIELFWYIRRKQAMRFKYNASFPADRPSDVLSFKSQNLDNFLRGLFRTIPLWIRVEVILLHGYAPWLGWRDNTWDLAAVVLLLPVIHEVDFFLLHRLIHTPFLSSHAHFVHHNSVNPSPWSSFSMPPVEGFFHHSAALWHLVIPSNPIVARFLLHVAGFGAVNGHIGFDKLEIIEDRPLTTHAFPLHHKHFDANYGGDGLVPLDKWFGTWPDGSKAQMEARFERRKARDNRG